MSTSRLRQLSAELRALEERLREGGGADKVERQHSQGKLTARERIVRLCDAGMEVIYTGLHQTPEMIATAAVQEDVDVVGLSILSGAHMTLFPRVLELLREHGRDDILITGGGIIPKEDMAALEAMGVGRLFGPGTPTTDLIEYIRQWFATREQQEA